VALVATQPHLLLEALRHHPLLMMTMIFTAKILQEMSSCVKLCVCEEFVWFGVFVKQETNFCRYLTMKDKYN
jgi:hypothetical protein